MTAITSTVRIHASKDEVWKILADLGGVQNFHPGVAKSYYTTDVKEGLGAARVCELLPVGKVEEHVIDWKHGEELTLDVVPLEKAPPLRDARGRIQLEVDGDETVVTMTVSYRLGWGPIGMLMDALLVRRQFKKVVPAVLRGLKRHAETGEVLRGAERKWVQPVAA